MSKRLKRKSKSVTYCSAINCKRNNASNPQLSFHRFPSEASRCKQWIQNCRRRDLTTKTPHYLSQNCWICSVHFEEHFLPKSSNIRKRLSSNAVPTIFDIPNQPPMIGKKQPLPADRQLASNIKWPRFFESHKSKRGSSDHTYASDTKRQRHLDSGKSKRESSDHTYVKTRAPTELAAAFVEGSTTERSHMNIAGLHSVAAYEDVVSCDKSVPIECPFCAAQWLHFL